MEHKIRSRSLERLIMISVQCMWSTVHIALYGSKCIIHIDLQGGSQNNEYENNKYELDAFMLINRPANFVSFCYDPCFVFVGIMICKYLMKLGSVMKRIKGFRVLMTSKVETGSKELIGTISEKDPLRFLFKSNPLMTPQTLMIFPMSPLK